MVSKQNQTTNINSFLIVIVEFGLTPSKPPPMILDPKLDDFSSSVEVFPSNDSDSIPPWLNGHEYRSDSFEKLVHKELVDFARFVLPSDEERHIRLLTINRYKSAISLLWPYSKIICVGSTPTSTNLPNGDMDFVVYDAPTNVLHRSLLIELHDHLQRLNIFTEGKCHIIEAKCPIIKGEDSVYKFSVDISVNNANGIMNIHRHKMYMKKYPALVPVLMFVKFLLYANDMDAPYSGGISSNTLIQMIVFVLQCGSEVDQLNCGKILLNFLDFFGRTFNYITTGISTRNGGRTFSRMTNGSIEWKNSFVICIEDPQIPGNFLGGNSFKSPQIRELFSRTSNTVRMRKFQSTFQSFIARVIKKEVFDEMILYRSQLHQKFQTLCRSTCRNSITLLTKHSSNNDNNRKEKNKTTEIIHKAPYKR